jgi:hypothetical protein
MAHFGSPAIVGSYRKLRGDVVGVYELHVVFTPGGKDLDSEGILDDVHLTVDIGWMVPILTEICLGSVENARDCSACGCRFL